jgi:hypothetical protein
MGRRRIRLDEEDLRSILEEHMRGTWFPEDGKIVGIELRTKNIKKGGDYYKDGVDDPDYPKDGIEVVRWIRVMVESSSRKEERDGESEGDEEDTP